MVVVVRKSEELVVDIDAVLEDCRACVVSGSAIEVLTELVAGEAVVVVVKEVEELGVLSVAIAPKFRYDRTTTAITPAAKHLKGPEDCLNRVSMSVQA